MKIYKSRRVKTPTRGTARSAGIDFYVPEGEGGLLEPGQSMNIPSGIYVKLPEGTALVMHNKSGVALRNSLQVGACVIDEDYQGEIHLHVVNVGTETTEILPGMKLVQGLILDVHYSGIEEVDSLDELYTEKTARGVGGFGSTGKF